MIPPPMASHSRLFSPSGINGKYRAPLHQTLQHHPAQQGGLAGTHFAQDQGDGMRRRRRTGVETGGMREMHIAPVPPVPPIQTASFTGITRREGIGMSFCKFFVEQTSAHPQIWGTGPRLAEGEEVHRSGT